MSIEISNKYKKTLTIINNKSSVYFINRRMKEIKNHYNQKVRGYH
jgi:hypothetical protein